MIDTLRSVRVTAARLTTLDRLVPCLIIHMKKLLDSDWLRAVQFKCNTSAKSVTPVQKVQHQCKLHIVILDYDLKKDIEKVVGQ